jgi:hypothetical protein
MVAFTPQLAAVKTEGSTRSDALPPIIADLIRQLPSATTYAGPVPEIEALMQIIRDVPIPSHSASNDLKRRTSDDRRPAETTNTVDVFRKRQAEKVKRARN